MSTDPRQEYYKRAVQLEKQGRCSEAAEIFGELALVDDQARALYRGQEYEAAVRVLMQSVGLRLDEPVTARHIARLDDRGRRRVEQAAVCASRGEFFRLAASLFEATGDTRRAADNLRRAGDGVAAARLESQALGPLGSSNAVSLESARELEKSGRYDVAMKVYIGLKRLGDAARMARMLGRPDEAAELFEQAGKAFEAAMCFREIGNSGKALDALVRVLKDDPRYREAAIQAIEMAEENNHFSYDLDHFLVNFLRTKPANDREVGAFLNLAKIYRQHDHPDYAEQAIRSVLDVAPNHQGAQEQLNYIQQANLASEAVFERILREDQSFLEGTRDAVSSRALADLPDLPDLPGLPGLPDAPSPSGSALPAWAQSTTGDRSQVNALSQGTQAAPHRAPNPHGARAGGTRVAAYEAHRRPNPYGAPQRPTTGQGAYAGGTMHSGNYRHPGHQSSFGHQGAPHPNQSSMGRSGAPHMAQSSHGYRPAPQGPPITGQAGTAPGTAMMGQGQQQPQPPAVAEDTWKGFEAGAVVSERYRIEGLLGEGGMAKVFKVWDLELSEHVALKLFTQEGADKEMLQRFKQELSLSRKLSHPNVIRLYDLGRFRNKLFITMELLDGKDLDEVLDKPMEPRRAVGWLAQICRGLDVAHKAGVVHRDIKPQNIFVCSDGVLKVMDFGIAKQTRQQGMTSANMVAGTPEYMSPEQISGFSTVTHSTDLYAVGVMAFQMFTGHLPFTHEEMLPLLMMHLNDAPPKPRDLNPHISPQIEACILKLLEKSPENRFENCEAIIRAFTAALQA